MVVKLLREITVQQDAERGHRHNILGASWLTAGAGAKKASLVELFVQ